MDEFKNIQPGDMIQTADRTITGVVVHRFPLIATTRPTVKVVRRNQKPALVAVDDIAIVWRRETVQTAVTP